MRQLLVGMTAGIVILTGVGKVGAQAPPPAVVAVTKVISSGEQGVAEFVGTTSPTRHSIVGSAVEGRVLDVLVDDGDYLEFAESSSEPNQVTAAEGELTAATDDENASNRPVMVKIRTATLEIQVHAAEATLKVREKELDLLKTSLPTEVARAKDDKAASEATLEHAKSSYDRQKILQEANPGAVSREILDLARSEWMIAKSAAESADKNVALLEETLELKIEQAEAQVEVERQAVNLLKDQLEKYTIRAPFPGFIAVKHAEIGDWIQRGDPVVEIMQLDPLELRVNIPEEYIAKVYRARELRRAEGEELEVEVRFQAIPGRTFAGRVARVVPQADLRTRAFPVIVHVDNPDHGEGPILKSGMLGRAAMPIGGRDDRLLVPKDSLVLQKKSESEVIYQVIVADPVQGEDGEPGFVARIVPVEVGEASGSLIEVRGVLLEGEKIVVEGNERVRPGQTLMIAAER